MSSRSLAPLAGWLDRLRPLRFVVAGGINTLLSYAVYALMLWLDLALALASLVSLVAGISVGFVTQASFVFRSPSRASLGRFVLAWAAMYGLHFGIVSSLMRLGVHPLVGALVALVAIAALSYFVLRDLVFRAGDDQTNKR